MMDPILASVDNSDLLVVAAFIALGLLVGVVFCSWLLKCLKL